MISKKDVVAKAASAVGVTQKDCLAIVDAFIEAVIEAVATKDDVNLGDLGKIKIVDTKPTAETKKCTKQIEYKCCCMDAFGVVSLR